MSVMLGCLKRLVRNPLNLIFLLVFPVIFSVLIMNVKNGDADTGSPIKLGIVDLDNSVLSETVVNQMDLRYTCTILAEGDVNAALSEQKVSWVLTIPNGYQEDILKGSIPNMEGSSIAISDVQYIASSSVQAQTKALLTLAAGTDEADLPSLVAQWKADSSVVLTDVEYPASWETAQFWVAFYGWIAMLTAFFLVRTVMVDRREGLPERVGVLPVSRRKYLLQCILAVFILCEFSAILLMFGIAITLGSLMPNPLYILLLFSVYNLFATGLSVAMFSVFKSDANISMAITMISTLLAMLGGTYWPIEFMPEFMQRMAYFSPNYWLSTGLRNIEIITVQNYWRPILLLFCFSFVVYLLASWRRVERAED